MPKISDFPNTATLADTDLLVVASGASNKQIQYGQLHEQLGVAFTDTDGALSVESSVADGETAVAVAVGGTGLTDYRARLLSVQNGTTEHVAMTALGSFVLFPENTFQVYDLSGSVQGIYGYRNGEATCRIGSSDGVIYNDVTIDTSLTDAVLSVNFFDSVGRSIYLNASETSQSQIRVFGLSRNLVALHPYVSDGASAVAHDLDTASALSNSGAKLLRIKNNNSERFAIGADGRIIAPSAPPANASADGIAGSITWDSGFLYVCVATNTWKRAAISTW